MEQVQRILATPGERCK